MSKHILEAKGVKKVFPGTVALQVFQFHLMREKCMQFWGKMVQVKVR